MAERVRFREQGNRFTTWVVISENALEVTIECVDSIGGALVGRRQTLSSGEFRKRFAAVSEVQR